MSDIDDMIADIDNQLMDIETAKSAAIAKGKKPGEYDLSVLAGAAKKDRLAQEEAQSMKSAQVFNDNRQAPEAAVKQIPLPDPSMSQSTDPITTTQPPSRNTYSRFSVGGIDYNVIKDNEDARRMIQYDDDGNVNSDSPVQVVGKDINGGFILAAQKDLRGVTKMSIPITQGQGVNFPGLESDTAGAEGKMSSLHFKDKPNGFNIFDPEAARQIFDIYQRTDKN